MKRSIVREVLECASPLALSIEVRSKSARGLAHSKTLARHLVAFLFLSVALFFSGCAYRLGPVGGQAAGARSVQVRPFANNALEPRLSEAVVNSVRKSIQRDGTFRLNSSNDSDIIVSGTILKFDRAELSFQPGDIITPRDYRVAIIAKVTALERATG